MVLAGISYQELATVTQGSPEAVSGGHLSSGTSNSDPRLTRSKVWRIFIYQELATVT
jgi:hypothetical protein